MLSFSTKLRPLIWLSVVAVLSMLQGCVKDGLTQGPDCFSTVTTQDASGVNIQQATLNASYTLSVQKETSITEAGFYLGKTNGTRDLTEIQWTRSDAEASAIGTLKVDIGGLEPETEYVYYAYIRTSTEKENIVGEYKFFTTAAIPEVTTVITEGAARQTEHLYTLYGSYHLAGSDVMSSLGFKFWISADPDHVFDGGNALPGDSGTVFSEPVTLDVLDVEYSYHAYIYVGGRETLISGDTLKITPYSETVVITEKYEIAAPGIVDLFGSFVLGGNSEAVESGFHLLRNDEWEGIYPTDAVAEDGTIYLSTDFIDYDHAHYRFRAYVIQADGSEVVGEWMDIDYTTPVLPVSNKPTIDDVYVGDLEVTGRGVSGADITVIYPSGAERNATVDANGIWRSNVPETLEAGQTIEAYQAEPEKQRSESVYTIVKQRVSAPPTIDEVYTNHTEVTGTGIPGSKITVIFPQGAERTVDVGSDNRWSCAVVETLVTGKLIGAIQTETHKSPSQKVTTEVKAIPLSPSEPPTINPVYNTDTEITGTGIADSEVTIYFPSGVEITVMVAEDNTWTCPVNEDLDPGMIIYADQTEVGKDRSLKVNTTVLEAVSAPPTIHDVYKTDSDVTGTGIAGATVTVTFPNGTTRTVSVDSYGNWSCMVSGTLVVGELIYATQTEPQKRESDRVYTAVKEVVLEISDPPFINDIYEGDQQVTGTGIAGSYVTVIFPDGTEATTIVQSNNKWMVEVSGDSLVEGQVVHAYQTEGGKNRSEEAQTTVLPPRTSAPPTINDVYEGETEITGTGVSGAIVTVIFWDYSEATVEVGNDGRWTCPYDDSQAGDTIRAYQVEQNKLRSEEMQTVVLAGSRP